MIVISIVIIYLIFALSLFNKKVKGWIQSSPQYVRLFTHLVTITILGFVTLGVVGTEELNLFNSGLSFSVTGTSIILFATFLLFIPSVFLNDSKFTIPILILSLSFCSGNILSYLLVSSLSTIFLPRETLRNEVAVKFMFLLFSALLITLYVLPAKYAFITVMITIFIKVVFYKFNFENKNDSSFVELIFVLAELGFVIPYALSSEYGDIKEYFGFAFMALGLLFAGLEFSGERINKHKGLLLSFYVASLGLILSTGIVSVIWIIYLASWTIMSLELIEYGNVIKIKKIISLILLSNLCFAPFLPGGWSLYFLITEFVSKNTNLLYLLPFVVIGLYLFWISIDQLYDKFMETEFDGRPLPLDICESLLILLVIGTLYYLTIPDVFTANSAFVIMKKIGLETSGDAGDNWRLKNILFFCSILFPVALGALYVTLRRKGLLSNSSLERVRFVLKGTIVKRISVEDKSFTINMYQLSVPTRNGLELVLRGAFVYPILFIVDVLGNIGWWLSRIRPKGINSNLLYAIVLTAIILIFYIKLIL